MGATVSILPRSPSVSLVAASPSFTTVPMSPAWALLTRLVSCRWALTAARAPPQCPARQMRESAASAPP